MRYRSPLVGVALVLAAGFVGAGCGESTADAEKSLCADLATLRASVQTLADMDSSSTVDEFKDARKNVQRAWADTQDAAANLGDERFDDVQDAWDDVADAMDNVDDKDTLAEAHDEITGKLDAFDDAKQEFGSSIDCSDANA